MGHRAKQRFSAEEYRMAEKHLREMQLKTTLRFHFTPVRMTKNVINLLLLKAE
jgi:hypothetical protein